MSNPPASGPMTWAQAAAGPLAAATCLWQDLDGLHVAEAPPDPPPTSILWAWRADGWLVRVRLDGDTALVAVHDGTGLTRTVPWNAGEDLRVAASRGPAAASGGPGAVYEQVVLDGIDDNTGPITFLRPA